MILDSIIEMQTRGIGASKASWVLNVSKYGNQTDLYNSIKGLVDPFTGNRETRKGNLYERGVYDEYQEEFQHPDSTSEYQPPVKISETTDFIYCHVDGLETDQDGNLWILEIKKIADIRKIESYLDDYSEIHKIMPDWYFQNLHQLYCYPDAVGVKQIILDENTGFVSVSELIRNDEIQENIKKLITKEIKFWYDHILTAIPPESTNYDVTDLIGETETPDNLKNLHIRIVRMQEAIKINKIRLEDMKADFTKKCKLPEKRLAVEHDSWQYIATHTMRPGNLVINIANAIAHGYITEKQVEDTKTRGNPIDKWSFKRKEVK